MQQPQTDIMFFFSREKNPIEKNARLLPCTIRSTTLYNYPNYLNSHTRTQPLHMRYPPFRKQ